MDKNEFNQSVKARIINYLLDNIDSDARAIKQQIRNETHDILKELRIETVRVLEVLKKKVENDEI